MCGILALVDTPWQQAGDAALRPLEPRGPDGKAFWAKDGALLGHARLSVIDLEGGAQPMASADGRYVLAYNGELYNFRALRAELEARGHRFRTRSDTEVLLYALIEWGRGALARLDGMFAFALWDARERRLL
ncbi:MAG TPA: asparagine synthetase B, partial [Burkholderiales bacterium]|nr:asparagine synthetase B [Burkholderiales bacterium]